MSSSRSYERALCAALRAAALQDVWADTVEPFGVIVYRRSSPIGMWSFVQDRFQYRSIANYEPKEFASSFEEAVDVMQRILDELRCQ